MIKLCIIFSILIIGKCSDKIYPLDKIEIENKNKIIVKKNFGNNSFKFFDKKKK